MQYILEINIYKWIISTPITEGVCDGAWTTFVSCGVWNAALDPSSSSSS